MAHELDFSTGVAAIAYAQGDDVPWHGYGFTVKPNASVEEWLEAARLNYRILSTPVNFFLPGDPTPREVENRRVFYRNDTGAALAVNSGQFKVHQPDEILATFKKLIVDEGSGWTIRTAGALRGGAVVWAMASHPDLRTEVSKGDGIVANLLLSTAVDGTMATEGRVVVTRTVCANTLAASRAEGVKAAKQSHRSGYKAGQMIASIETISDSFAEIVMKQRELMKVRVSQEKARNFIRELLSPEQNKELLEAFAKIETAQTAAERFMAQATYDALNDKARSVRGEERILELFNGAQLGAQFGQGTAYGLLNAVTYYVDHDRGSNQDTRIQSAWYGNGAATKSAAFDKLVTLVN